MNVKAFSVAWIICFQIRLDPSCDLIKSYAWFFSRWGHEGPSGCCLLKPILHLVVITHNIGKHFENTIKESGRKEMERMTRNWLFPPHPKKKHVLIGQLLALAELMKEIRLIFSQVWSRLSISMWKCKHPILRFGILTIEHC